MKDGTTSGNVSAVPVGKMTRDQMLELARTNPDALIDGLSPGLFPEKKEIPHDPVEAARKRAVERDPLKHLLK